MICTRCHKEYDSLGSGLATPKGCAFPKSSVFDPESGATKKRCAACAEYARQWARAHPHEYKQRPKREFKYLGCNGRRFSDEVIQRKRDYQRERWRAAHPTAKRRTLRNRDEEAT
jgi:hypothetical protein